jgi:phosphatidylglycerophosphatase A
MKYLDEIAEFILTACYIGKIKIAPGTFGSLIAFPICYIIMDFSLKHQVVFYISGYNPNEQQFLSVFFIEILATIILFFAGTYFTKIYIKDAQEQDPKEVVIDEVVGQMLVIILTSFSVIFVYSSSVPQKIEASYIDFIFLFLMPFVLFRAFDILKPWPINWLDSNIKGSLGVMIDDVAAALFAVVCQYVIVFLIVNFFPTVV